MCWLLNSHCLFIFVADHEPGTPELQIYEIPLDSLGHQRVYIGTKRVAPKTDEREEAVKFTKTKKQRKKDKRELDDNTLPRTGRRDHIYSSVNDEVSSTLSEGTYTRKRFCFFRVWQKMKNSHYNIWLIVLTSSM